MLKNIKFGKKKANPLNYLELTPFPVYSYEKKEDGLVNVLVPKFTDKFFGKYLQPRLKKPYIRANLDEFGSATWQFIDGKNKVSAIAEKLVEIHGENIQPVHLRLTKFLTHLYNNGFITFNEFKKGKDND